MGHALIVEDDADSARMMAALVARDGHSVSCAHSLASARRFLAMQQPDFMLLDLNLPDGNGFELFEQRALLSDTEVVLMTGQASLETSIKALRLGAADYLVKPVNPQQLSGLLSRLIRPSRLRAELAKLTEHWRQTGRFGQLIGGSLPMQRVYQQISRVAETAVTVFVHGESGTGKELVARAVHDLSRRREQPFLAVNCGALSPHLIESEIFGHERGSFTGAERQHHGFFERANGGTLFLDEVTEMPLELQVKLLRVLESGTFMRVGSTVLQQTDVRIIAATNRDAVKAVERGTMREDLLYRLNVFPIGLPPLRERADDIPMLAQSFLEDLEREEKTGSKHFTPAALEQLGRHGWPGNVRELRNVVQRAWVMAHGPEIDGEWLPGEAAGPYAHARSEPFAPSLRPSTPERAAAAEPVQALPDAPAEPVAAAVPAAQAALAQPHPSADSLRIAIGTPLAEIERQVILATFDHCAGHKERCAALLGISMKTLYNRLKDYQRQ